MDYSYRSLLCFKKVAECENLTKAAEALYISPGQLSRIISELEDTFHTRFFDRENGMKLNACGEAFYSYVQKMETLTRQAEKTIRSIQLHESAQLTIASNCGAYMPLLLQKLMEASPSLRIHEAEATGEECLQYLRDGIADFLICCPPIEDREMQSILLFEEHACVLLPRNHPLARRGIVSLQDLQGETFIGQAKGYADRDGIDNACLAYHFVPTYSVETEESFQISRMVERGFGIALVPFSVAKADVGNPALSIAELQERLTAKVALTYRKDRLCTEKDRSLLQVIRDAFSSLQDPSQP